MFRHEIVSRMGDIPEERWNAIDWSDGKKKDLTVPEIPGEDGYKPELSAAETRLQKKVIKQNNNAEFIDWFNNNVLAERPVPEAMPKPRMVND